MGKLDMQRSLASHQRSVQNRLDSKRFEAYKLNAIKMDKLKQEFARSRFTINQLKTANGPLVDTTQFTESSCTADQFYRVGCTETTSDRSSLYLVPVIAHPAQLMRMQRMVTQR